MKVWYNTWQNYSLQALCGQGGSTLWSGLGRPGWCD